MCTSISYTKKNIKYIVSKIKNVFNNTLQNYSTTRELSILSTNGKNKGDKSHTTHKKNKRHPWYKVKSLTHYQKTFNQNTKPFVMNNNKV